MQRSALLLSISYIPLKIISWKKAVGLVIGRSRGQVLAEYSLEEGKFNPAVIRLTVQTPNPYDLLKTVKFSKKNIFLRDRYTCCYCYKTMVYKELTIDHVVPRSKGGTTNYLNCVTACKPCNAWKDNKTPEQAGMRLLKPIRKPELKDIFHAGSIPEEWKLYLNF